MKRLKWMLIAVVLLAWTSWGQIVPRVDCATVDYGHNGSYPLFFNLWGDQQAGFPQTAYAQFGYFSYGTTTVPAGSSNEYDSFPVPGFATVNPPTNFTPGTHLNVFGGGFAPSENGGWLLNGLDVVPDPSLPPCPAMLASGTPFPPQFAPLGLANGQTIRINVLANRAGSCAGTLNFLDSSLNALGRAKLVNLASGQGTSFDLVGTSSLVSPGQRKQVVPQFVDSSGQYRSCQASVEVFTSSTGVTVASSKWIQPVYQYDFDLQGLSAGQTLRINVSSPAAGNQTTGCGAALSFTDATGAPLGNSSSGSGVPFVGFLDLPSTSVPGLTGWAGGRVQVRPVLNTVSYQNSGVTGFYDDVLVNQTCLASVEIFDTLSGLTRVLSKPEPVH
jgi:hypothetical protein